MRPLIILLMLLTVLPSRSVSAETYLTWESQSGKHTIEAQFLKLDNGFVELKRKDGKVVRVPQELLSESSWRLAQKLSAERNDSAETVASSIGPNPTHAMQYPLQVKGRTAREWVELLDKAYSSQDAVALRQALDPTIWTQLGDEALAAIPVLERIASTEDRKKRDYMAPASCIACFGPLAQSASKTLVTIEQRELALIAPGILNRGGGVPNGSAALACLAITGADNSSLLKLVKSGRVDLDAFCDIIRSSGAEAVRPIKVYLDGPNGNRLGEAAFSPQLGDVAVDLVKRSRSSGRGLFDFKEQLTALGPNGASCAPQLVTLAVKGDADALDILASMGPAAEPHITPLVRMLDDPALGSKCFAALAIISPSKIPDRYYEKSGELSLGTPPFLNQITAQEVRHLPAADRAVLCQINCLLFDRNGLNTALKPPRTFWRNGVIVVDHTPSSICSYETAVNLDLIGALQKSPFPLELRIRFRYRNRGNGSLNNAGEMLPYTERRWAESSPFTSLVLHGPLSEHDVKRLSRRASVQSITCVDIAGMDGKWTWTDLQWVISEASKRKWPLTAIALSSHHADVLAGSKSENEQQIAIESMNKIHAIYPDLKIYEDEIEEGDWMWKRMVDGSNVWWALLDEDGRERSSTRK